LLFKIKSIETLFNFKRPCGGAQRNSIGEVPKDYFIIAIENRYFQCLEHQINHAVIGNECITNIHSHCSPKQGFSRNGGFP